jgi:hypothetical protein
MADAAVFTGSRDFDPETWDARPVWAVLKRLKPGTTVIHGNCRGLDRFVDRAARQQGLIVHAVPALWDEQGTGAGMVRNALMIDLLKVYQRYGYDCMVYAFPAPPKPGKRSGTQGCIDLAKKAGFRVKGAVLRCKIEVKPQDL